MFQSTKRDYSEIKNATPGNNIIGSMIGEDSDSYTEYSRQSFGSRIIGSFLGLLFGLLLFAGSFVLLWKNEDYAVERVKKELFINQNTIQIASSPIDRNNDNKLIAVAGNVSVSNSLTDGTATVSNALVLKRNVRMYQWKESKHTTKKKTSGGSTTTKTTYTYHKDWSNAYIDSSRFKRSSSHINPAFPFKSTMETASSGKMGDFIITQDQIGQINDYQPLNELPENPEYILKGNTYYKGSNPDTPEIGDLKISYQFIPSGAPVSFIGRQTNKDRIKPMQTKDGSIYLQYDGLLSKDEMLARFQESNSFKTWGLRALGIFLMWIGMGMILSPLTTLMSFVPFLGSIFSFISGTITFLLSLCLSCITIAVAWIAYRPMIAAGLFGSVLVFVILIGMIFRSKQAKKTENGFMTATATPPPPVSRPPAPKPAFQKKNEPLEVITR